MKNTIPENNSFLFTFLGEAIQNLEAQDFDNEEQMEEMVKKVLILLKFEEEKKYKE